MNAPPNRSATGAESHQPLVLVLAGVGAGIAADRYLAWSVAVWVPLALVAWALWWRLWHAERLRAAAWLLLLSAAATGAAWHHCRWSLFEHEALGRYARGDAEPVALDVLALAGARRVPPPPPDPLRTIAIGERTRMEVEVLALRDGDQWQAVSGVATLLVDGSLRDVKSGDRLRVFGQLRAIDPPHNPGEYDFARHARASRRLCSLRCEFPECVTRLAQGAWWDPARWVDRLRSSGDGLLWRNLGPRSAGLAAAMFLGSREELQPDEAQAFMETGTIHLLVVSGLNVAILAGSLFLCMRVCLVPRSWALAVVAVTSVLYAAITDAQPPVVRATAMVLVACVASTLGRRVLGFNSLAAAGLIVLAINPAELFQAGTQLSFLSVAVLVWLAERRAAAAPVDPLDRLIARTRPWPERLARRFFGDLWQATLASLVIWLVICPLVMARFHLVSPVAIVLGPLLTIPVALAMASGLGILVFGWLLSPLAALLARVCDWNLWAMEWSVDTARRIPGNHFWASGPADWWLAGFYAAALVLVLAPRWRPPVRWCGALVTTWVAVGLCVSLVSRRDNDQLRCAVLSVGHGTAVVVELPGGQTLLYDAGRLGSPTSAARAVSGYLWSRGIRHLDAVVVSHADADHYNALPTLVDQFSVGVVYVSPVMFENDSRALSAFRASIERAGLPLRTVWSGDRLTAAAQANLDVLHPPRRGVFGSDNANSIVLSVEYAGRRVLLTGDLESPGLEDVLAEEPLDCDVLLAPHHGSAFSDPPNFAAWSTPEFTIISGGPRDRLESVSTAYSQRGSQVLHTADDGAVEVTIAPGRFDVECWHQTH